jgi:uncharacterized protein (DUF1501 family)
MDRRSFLRKSALAAAGTLFVPRFLRAWDGHQLPGANARKLVVVQLSGGNDGLNTVVPFADDQYHRLRPNLALPVEKLHRLDDYQALHHRLVDFKALYDEGHLAICHAVGYPDPDRSHFRSMDIWHTASGSDDYLSTGWLGRYLDSDGEGCDSPHHAIEVDDTVSLALKGSLRSGFAMSDPKRLQRGLQNPVLQDIVRHHHEHAHDGNVAYLYRTLLNTASSADYLAEKLRARPRSLPVPYPNSFFAKDLRQVADLIVADADTRVYYVTLSGFDTHANQFSRQDKLLGQLGQGLGAFVADLKAQGRLEETLVMVFSEFGRRVAENGSMGTDHGAANNLFLIGGGLRKKGMLHPAPDLTDLDNGDLRYRVDFRSVYATVLQRWLGADAMAVIGRPMELLDFI